MIYHLMMTLHNINRPTAENPNAYVRDVESLVFDENNQFVVGYKTFSGQTYPILTLDEMKAYFPNTSTPTPTPTPSNIPTPTPTVPATTPSAPTVSLLLLLQPQILLLLPQKQP